jgi:lysyl-tRNA synthetase class 2
VGGRAAELAGAVAYRPAHRHERAPRLLAVALALVGVLGVVSSITPRLRARSEVLYSLIPPTASNVATALALALSVGLLILAGSLRRRKRRAWQLAVAALGGVALLHVAKGLDLEESGASLLLLAALAVFREDFDVEGDPETPTTFARQALAVLAGGAILGLLLVEGQSFLAGDALPLEKAFTEILHGYAGLGPDRLEGRGAHAVPNALVLYVLAGGGWLAYLWLRPRRQYVRQHRRDRQDARRIVEQCGADSLDYFALRHDKDYHFSPARDAFVAYRVSGGVALISGDPVGNPGAVPAVLGDFVDYAHRHGWRVAAIGVGPDFVPLYEEFGLRTIYVGDEAVVDPRRFSLDGRGIRKVRQSVNRLAKAGYSSRIVRRDELEPALEADLRRVSQLWLGGQPERGFSMAMDDIWAPEHGACVFAIAIGPDGRPAGFVHLVPVPQAGGLSLAAMRRLPETPNGLMEFILCELFAWGKEHDLRRVSLNFNAFGEILRADQGCAPRWQQALRWGLFKADRLFQVERLLSFNKKFFPGWEPRYAAYEQRRDLPLAALVMLASESLIDLPAPIRRRLRRRRPATGAPSATG